MKQSLAIISLFTLFAIKAMAQPAQTQPPARSPFSTISNTQYSSRTELFAEFRPLLLNKAARFTAHLTQLGELFKPYSTAEVTLVLTINGSTAWQQTLKEPAAPGIYRFPVQSATAGTGTVIITLKMPGYKEEFIIPGVTVYADTAAALATNMAINEKETENIVAYYKEKSWLEAFATAIVVGTKDKIWVPSTALWKENSGAFIFVQEDPEHFKKVAVKTGRAQNNQVEIITGLSDGTRIVTIGAAQINAAAKK